MSALGRSHRVDIFTSGHVYFSMSHSPSCVIGIMLCYIFIVFICSRTCQVLAVQCGRSHISRLTYTGKVFVIHCYIQAAGVGYIFIIYYFSICDVPKRSIIQPFVWKCKFSQICLWQGCDVTVAIMSEWWKVLSESLLHSPNECTAFNFTLGKGCPGFRYGTVLLWSQRNCIKLSWNMCELFVVIVGKFRPKYWELKNLVVIELWLNLSYCLIC